MILCVAYQAGGETLGLWLHGQLQMFKQKISSHARFRNFVDFCANIHCDHVRLRNRPGQ